jgi:hypothetical protein
MESWLVGTVLAIILAAGMLGGLINFFIADPATETPLEWWKHVIIGVGAAFMVPVFLNMISSKLVEDISGASLNAAVLQKLLVLAGFCLVAAVSSRAFIRSLTDRILKEVREAKREARQANERATNAEAIAELDKNEPEANQFKDGAPESRAPVSDERPLTDLTESQARIIAALGSSKYSMRTRRGVAADTGLTYEQVAGEIPDLMSRGLVVQLLNSKQHRRWALTEEGRNLLREVPRQILDAVRQRAEGNE